MINVSWLDAKAFASWLSQKTGQKYRLPTEAEWEYAARAGTTTTFWWGQEVGSRQANCQNCNTGQPPKTLPVGSFKPNAFGIYDTSGTLRSGWKIAGTPTTRARRQMDRRGAIRSVNCAYSRRRVR